MVFEGQLDIDFNRGVIWFNGGPIGCCMLRICGLDVEKLKNYSAQSLIDISLDDRQITTASGEDLGVIAHITYGN